MRVDNEVCIYGAAALSGPRPDLDPGLGPDPDPGPCSGSLIKRPTVHDGLSFYIGNTRISIGNARFLEYADDDFHGT